MLSFLKRLLFGPPVDITGLVHQRKALILDVRTIQEFKLGHAKGSKNIPLHELSRKMAELKKQNRPIVACCRTGNRSGTAARMLRSAGIEAYNGGSWQNVQRHI